jgi:fructokinase
VDTTGAGDLYAAGFLHGYTQGQDLDACGRLGSLCAGQVVTQLGPRPQGSLKDLVARHLG